MLKLLLSFLVILPLLFNPSPIIANQTFEIKLIKAGFNPNNLQIKQGDIVIFINQDEVDRWPASDIHPTHAIYPEFDPQKAIKPKNFWKFQFKKPGTFQFHDHLHPELNGTIEVLVDKENSASPSPAPDFNSIIQTLKRKIEIAYKKFYYKIFPAKLEQDLKTFNSIEVAQHPDNLKFWIHIMGGKRFMKKMVDDSEGGSKVDCHQEAHAVGRAAYKLEKDKVFKQPDFNCHSGFLHGAMEAFIAENGGNNLPQAVTKLCKSFKTDFERFECLHGIGHGFTAYMDYDIPKTLDFCKKLESDYARRSCYGGVFMENILVAEGKGAIKAHLTNWVSEDPHFPCNAVEKDYFVQYECYQMQTSRMLDIFKYNFDKVREQCGKAPKDMVEVCFKSFGRDVAGQTLRDPVKIAHLCQTVPQDYFKECIRGALNVVIEFWGENLTNQPQQLCNRLGSDNKAFCYNLLAGRLKEIFGKNISKIQKVCEYGEKEFVEACIHGDTKT